jgi:hypothetical protein
MAKFLELNIGEMIQDIGVDYDLLDKKLNVQITKTEIDK